MAGSRLQNIRGGDGHRQDGSGHGLEARDKAPQPCGDPSAVSGHPRYRGPTVLGLTVLDMVSVMA